MSKSTVHFRDLWCPFKEESFFFREAIHSTFKVRCHGCVITTDGPDVLSRDQEEENVNTRAHVHWWRRKITSDLHFDLSRKLKRAWNVKLQVQVNFNEYFITYHIDQFIILCDAETCQISWQLVQSNKQCSHEDNIRTKDLSERTIHKTHSFLHCRHLL